MVFTLYLFANNSFGYSIDIYTLNGYHRQQYLLARSLTWLDIVCMHPMNFVRMHYLPNNTYWLDFSILKLSLSLFHLIFPNAEDFLCFWYFPLFFLWFSPLTHFGVVLFFSFIFFIQLFLFCTFAQGPPGLDGMKVCWLDMWLFHILQLILIKSSNIKHASDSFGFSTLLS